MSKLNDKFEKLSAQTNSVEVCTIINSKPNKRNGVIIGIIICSLVLIGILGSYAFFIATGQNRNEEVSVDTANISLIFSDGIPYINKNLNFGESVEKTFTIDNEGTKDAVVKMSWLNIINTYLEGSLTYSLSYSETEDGTYTDLVTDKNVPRSSEESTITLVNGLFIPTKTKYFYKLNITLNYTDFDQTADLKAILSTNFILEEEGFKVTFNNGDGTTTTKYISRDSNYGELPTPTREEYVFLGWFTASSGGTQVTSETKFTFNKDQTLYARWETVDENNVKKTLSKLKVSLKSGNPNFDNPATVDEGVYSMADDYGTSYYYRGAVKNNYVKFANFYWRIIRVNGDGSLRVQYDGTRAWVNGTSNSNRLISTGVSWINDYDDDAKYVGYMYGGNKGEESTSKAQAQKNETESDIKKTIDTWYENNIEKKGFSKYIADSIFCNDRSIPGHALSGWSSDTGLGYGSNVVAFSSFVRFYDLRAETTGSNIKPIFTCSQDNDKFTIKKENGNGALKYPVGLITADEVVAAGCGKPYTDNSSYYLYKGYIYWTFTPQNVFPEGAWHIAGLNIIQDTGALDGHYVGESFGVAPVINLTPEYFGTLIGDGTQGNPFRAPGDTP